MHWRTATAEELLTRGVWLAPYLWENTEVLIAVDSRGCVRKHVKLRPGVDEVRAVKWLEQLLDRIDPPRPKLELVKPIEPNDDQRPHACQRDDHLSFAIRLANQAAHRFRRYD